MKTKEKEFYRFILNKIYTEEKLILDTCDLYSIIGEAIDRFKIKNYGNKKKIAVDKICKIVPVEIIEEDKKFYRTKSKIYSFSFKKDDIDKILSKEEEEKKKVIVKETTPRKINLSTMEHVYRVCQYCAMGKKEYFFLKEIRKIFQGELENPNTKTIEGWRDSLGRHGILWDVRNDGKYKFRIMNIRDIMLTLDAKAKEWYGESLIKDRKKEEKVEKKVNLVVEIKKPEPKPVTLEMSYDTKYLIFSIGVILNNSKKNLTLDDMIVSLKKEFDLTTTKDELKELINKLPYFDSGIRKQLIGFKDPDCWYDIFDKFHPKNMKFTILARIGLTKAEIEKFIPGASIVSKINESDAIYCLLLDYSQKCFGDMLNLYSTFRGTDCILDNPEFATKLEKNLLIVRGLYNKNNPKYQAELEE